MGCPFHVTSFYSRKNKSCMYASQVSLVPGGTGQPNYSCMKLLNCLKEMHIFGWEMGLMPRRFVQFLGRATDCCPYLNEFWAEQPY